MRRLLFYISLCLSSNLYSQSILVNPTASPESVLTAEELTVEVLIDGGDCSEITNFELIDNPQAQYPSYNRSWGYFERGTSNFPFERGIVLTSGYARVAVGPSSPNSSDGDMFTWLGDSDATSLAGYPSYNTTVFEFDFVPFGNEISFNYIFASEEYPEFACGFSYNDVFGFIISGPGIVNDPGLSGKNIALLPNGDHVSIQNVNDQGCGDDTYYVAGGFTDIKYDGRTMPLTAYSEVQAGETYHIRLLVSDAGDGGWDSAVFLEAGSFSLGGSIIDLSGADIGEDYTVCDQSSFTLMVDIDVNPVSFQWYLNGNPITGATSQSYNATTSGLYEVEIVSGLCSTIVGVDLTFSTSPDAIDVEDRVCSETGNHIFNLEDYNDEIGPPDATYSYYLSFAGADQEIIMDLVPNPQNYVVTEANGVVTVYVRVENSDGCYRVVELNLEVGIGPDTAPTTYPICDDNGDGFQIFDLENYAVNLILSNPAGLEYEFFEDAGLTQLIPNPTTYQNTSPNQVIYVRIFNPSSGEEDCVQVEELTLVVDEFPLLQSENIVLCDNLNDNSEFVDLTNNQIVVSTGVPVNLNYFEQDGTPILTPTNYELTTSPTIITVMVANTNGTCSASDTITFNFTLAPDLVAASLEECSESETAEFILSEANSLVIGDTTDLEFSYYLTFAEAEQGDIANSLPDNFTNTIPNQVIFVRVLDTNTGCYNVVEVNLIVKNGPDSAPQDYPICDENGDGFAEFDLVNMAPNMLVGAPDNIVFGYFLDEDLTTPIPNPANFVNTTNPQIVYVSFIDSSLGDEACISKEALTLIVDEFPAIQSQIISICDNLNDNSEFIDLTQNDIVISEGITVNYSYFDQAGNQITNPTNYEITASPTVITVIVMNETGSCQGTETITIDFMMAPDGVDDSQTILNCSITDFSNFDLTQLNETLVTGGINNLNFSYHLTFNDAMNAQGALPENYTNTVPDQIVYVRIENENGCFDIVELILDTFLVHNQLNDILTVCDDPYEESDGIAAFNLTLMHEAVETSLGGSNYTVLYYLSLEDALAGINVITDPTQYQNISSPQTIFALANTPTQGCAGVVDFRIEVLPVPVFELPDYLAFCNYDEKSYEFLGTFNHYTWLDASGNVVSNESFVNFTQEGIYTLEVISDENDCAGRREIEIIFDNQPIITNIEVNEHTVTISAQGGIPPYEYSFNNGLTWTDDYIIQNVPGGIYDMIVRSKYGCISSAKTFGVLGIPNLVTPNGDGKNDYWEIRGLEAYPSAFIRIFDRFGKIFVERPLTTEFKWDGKYLGNPVPSGDYWYIITIEDGKSVSGHISVRNK